MKRYVSIIVIAISVSIGLAGCSGLKDGRSPEQWFKLTLGGLAGKDTFSFSGEAALRRNGEGKFEHNFAYEGKVVNHDELSMRNVLPADPADSQINSLKLNQKVSAANFRRQDGEWVYLSAGDNEKNLSLERFNPLKELDAIHNLPKQIQEERGGSRGMKVLRIEIEPEAARQKLSRQLESEMNAVKNKHAAAGTALTSANQSELEAVWNKGNKQLKQLLKDSDVRLVYHLTIHRKSGFPVRLSSDSFITYINLDGNLEQETMVNDVSFEP